MAEELLSGPGEAESALPGARRPLTILFCDLVSSTVLAQLLDPEDLRDFLESYLTRTQGIVEQFGGTIVQTQGDGLVVAFGWPQAREDDAERAVRAGSAILEAVAQLPKLQGFVPAARIGVATGLTLAGQPVGGTGTIDLYGAIPALASRLQNLARPGGLLMTAATRKRLGNRFQLRELGAQTVKGFSEPIEVWQLVGENLEGIRFDPDVRQAGSALSGRKESLDVLLLAWQQAEAGRGSMVLLEGEAGIGKSRLVSELILRIEAGGTGVFRLQCLPLYEGTPLHPFAELLAARLGSPRAVDAAERRRKLQAELAKAAEAGARPEAVAALMGMGDSSSPAAVIGEAERAQLLEGLVAWLLGLQEQGTLLLVLEDVHWADPTTLELLQRLSRGVAGRHVLLVATTRHSKQLPPERLRYTHLSLDRLSEAEARGLLASMPRTQGLEPEVVDALLARAEGIPLYLEELAQTLRDKGRIELPETLQDAMLSRVESLPGMSKAAEAAAVLYPLATPELVGDVIAAPVDIARDALRTLAGAGILVQEPADDHEERFHFRHALLQDAVYENIPRNRRRALHRRAVSTIRHLRRQMEEATPEILAEHLERAGDRLDAAGLWLLAGRRAAARSALHEAQRHFQRGLEGVAASGATEESVDLEVDLNLGLAPVLLATQGPSSPDVDRLFSRTRALRPKQLDAIWGLWRTETRADRQLELAEEMVRIATAADDRQLLLQAHHAQWATQFNRGDLQDALVHVDAAVALYRQEIDGKDASRFGGHDPLCCGHGVAALCQWAIGRPRAARQHLEAALNLARQLADAHTLAHTLDYAIMLAHHLRDLPLLEHYAEEAKAHAERNGLPHYLARATAFLAWQSGTLSPDEAALQRLQEALAVLQPIGDEEDFTFFLDLLAERCKDCGRHEEALAALEKARAALGQQRGVRYWEPELIRHTAMVLMDSGEAPGAETAVALLEEARTLALARGHLTLALRAALTLAESARQGTGAREALGAILAQLEQASELAEGRRAQELLRRSA